MSLRKKQKTMFCNTISVFFISPPSPILLIITGFLFLRVHLSLLYLLSKLPIYDILVAVEVIMKSQKEDYDFRLGINRSKLSPTKQRSCFHENSSISKRTKDKNNKLKICCIVVSKYKYNIFQRYSLRA